MEPLTMDERENVLPSGRSVVVRLAGGAEELEIRSSRGDVEVRIVLTEAGPVVRLCGARLELDAAETVAVNCRRFEVRATDDICLDGATIRLNSPEESV
jgi:phage gp45-like